MEIARSERLENAVSLLVSELVEHRGQIGHLVVILHASLACQVHSTFVATVGACHG